MTSALEALVLSPDPFFLRESFSSPVVALWISHSCSLLFKGHCFFLPPTCQGSLGIFSPFPVLPVGMASGWHSVEKPGFPITSAVQGNSCFVSLAQCLCLSWLHSSPKPSSFPVAGLPWNTLLQAIKFLHMYGSSSTFRGLHSNPFPHYFLWTVTFWGCRGYWHSSSSSCLFSDS